MRRSCVWSILVASLLMLLAHPVRAQMGNIVLNKSASESGMGPVVFPHWTHRMRFTCNVCHDAIFPMKAGESDITMDAIREKKFCGQCHNGRIVFDAGVQNCTRCHQVE